MYTVIAYMYTIQFSSNLFCLGTRAHYVPNGTNQAPAARAGGIRRTRLFHPSPPLPSPLAVTVRSSKLGLPSS